MNASTTGVEVRSVFQAAVTAGFRLAVPDLRVELTFSNRHCQYAQLNFVDYPHIVCEIDRRSLAFGIPDTGNHAHLWIGDCRVQPAHTAIRFVGPHGTFSLCLETAQIQEFLRQTCAIVDLGHEHQISPAESEPLASWSTPSAV